MNHIILALDDTNGFQYSKVVCTLTEIYEQEKKNTFNHEKISSSKLDKIKFSLEGFSIAPVLLQGLFPPVLTNHQFKFF